MTHDRTHYIERMKHQLDALDRRLDELSLQTHLGEVQAKEAWAQEIQRLKTQSKLAADKFHSLKDIGEDAWDQSVEEMDRLREVFARTVDRVKQWV
jgi:uncharacterized protein (DUF885 family)